MEAEMGELKQRIKRLEGKIEKIEALPSGQSDPDLLRSLYDCVALLAVELAKQETELAKQKTLMVQQQVAAAAHAGGSLPGITGVQAGRVAAGSTGISELMKPAQEVFVLKFKVHNTPTRTRSALKVRMDNVNAHGRIRRESITTVSATAIISAHDENQLAQFIMSLRGFAEFSETAIYDRPYILNPSLERVSLKLNPLVAEMFWKGLQVDKMSTATRDRYADPSQASSDPDGAASTASSLPNSSRGIDIPS